MSGIGKTVFAGTAPNALFLTTDPEGTESAQAFGSSAKELPVNDWDTFREYVDWIVRGDAHKEFEYVLLDTTDELEELCWQAQLVNDELKRASEYQPNKGDYPVVWRKVKAELGKLNRAPVSVIYLAHMMHIEREDESGEDTITLAMPEMGSRKRGDLSSWFCGTMGLVGYMRTQTLDGGEVQRQLMTGATNRYVAKDRTNSFGAGIVNPTVPGMLATIAARGTSKPTTTTRTARRRRAS